MNIIKVSVLSLFLACTLVSCATIHKQVDPLSFAELNAEPRLQITENKWFTTSDNLKLAYFNYETPSNKPNHIVIFIHGGGACSCLGYQYLADTLSQKYNTKVFLLDIRGHGLSEGQRGDTPTKERLWQDISEFIQYVKTNNTVPVFLGGHSSGGGLVLNYATWKKRVDTDGYIFVSPKLGYKSDADRYPFTSDPFAKAHIGTIIINKISNGTAFEHTTSVEMNYSKEAIMAEPLLVNKYTCSTIKAVTPTNPKKQFSEVDKPFLIFVGAIDELMEPNNTIKYLDYSSEQIKQKSQAIIVPSQNHLGILRISGDIIANYLNEIDPKF